MNSDLYKTNRVPQSLNECPSSVRAGQSTGTTVNQYYCGVCATGKICNDTFARVPFETLADVESAIKAAEEKYFLFVLPLAGGAVVGCIVIAVVLTCIWKTRPHSVIPFPLIIKVGRAFLLILEVCHTPSTTRHLGSLKWVGVCCPFNWSMCSVFWRASAKRY